MSFIAEFSFQFSCFVLDVNQLLKVKFVVYYVITKMGANENKKENIAINRDCIYS